MRMKRSFCAAVLLCFVAVVADAGVSLGGATSISDSNGNVAVPLPQSNGTYLIGNSRPGPIVLAGRVWTAVYDPEGIPPDNVSYTCTDGSTLTVNSDGTWTANVWPPFPQFGPPAPASGTWK